MRKLAQIITKIIDFFYRPFSKWISEQLFRYAACGGGNLVLDWVLYFLIYNFVIGHDLVYFQLSTFNFQLCLTPHIATLCIVFPITLLTGFWLQKYVTFTASRLNGWRQLSRYILLRPKTLHFPCRKVIFFIQTKKVPFFFAYINFFVYLCSEFAYYA